MARLPGGLTSFKKPPLLRWPPTGSVPGRGVHARQHIWQCVSVMWPSRLPAKEPLLSFQAHTSGPLTARALLRGHVAMRPIGTVRGHKSGRSHTSGRGAQDSDLSSVKAGSACYTMQVT